jgi:hypothetical protein
LQSGSTTTLGADEPNRPQVHLTLQTRVIAQSDDVKNGGPIDLQLTVTIEARKFHSRLEI